jgi:hypothetical protein
VCDVAFILLLKTVAFRKPVVIFVQDQRLAYGKNNNLHALPEMIVFLQSQRIKPIRGHVTRGRYFSLYSLSLRADRSRN